MQTIRLSKAPIIASHSAVRALANVSRNMDDEQLLALKKNGGVIQIVGFASYLKVAPPEYTAAVRQLRREFGGAAAGCPIEDPQKSAEYDKRLAELDAKWPGARASVKDLVNHIDYAVKLIGIGHVGISSDFDGGGGIKEWNSAAEAFNVTLELVRRGYTEDQIRKLWGGNLLRVWGEVERVAKTFR